eukprot:CAMPEP_0170122228 /NCGR_PEP_ID=MMETSP0020_2-20130122/16510_1 /TAXON_ID=98059 /ORGANISM="Dinobryon sp., Strain UTEXLB2267" /LENGTH=1705 /DNA_ID=CAMNT_0010353037 /DNA_START=47 /DNA_END=5164 /DNA_ORIENTATION=+
MQKSEFQITGYLYKRSSISPAAWSLRYAILSTDTGAVKLYAEKSGIRTIKEQLNVRKSRLIPLADKDTNKSNSFQISLEESTKEESTVLTLAAMNENELKEWTIAIESCCSMGDDVVRRRHLVSPSPSPPKRSMLQPHSSDKENKNLSPKVDYNGRQLNDMSSEARAQRSTPLISNTQDVAIASAKPPVRRTMTLKTGRSDGDDTGTDYPSPPNNGKVKTTKRTPRPPSPSIDSDATLNTSPNSDSPSKGLKSNERKRNDLPPRPQQQSRSPLRGRNFEFDEAEISSASPMPPVTRRKASISKLSKIFDKTPESEEEPPATVIVQNNYRPFHSNNTIQNRKTPSPSPADDDSTIDDNESICSVNSAERKRESKGGSIKIVKFRNLLNSNGLDSPLNRDKSASGKFSKEEESKPEAVVEVEEVKPKPKVKYNPKELTIENRPTSKLREGYLYKLDSDSFDAAEDSWIKQFVSLDLSVGQLCHFAEINGRKIPRGKFNVLTSDIELHEEVHAGQEYSFKIFPKTPTPEDDSTPVEPIPENSSNTAVFAADSKELLHYWLISMDDCFEYVKEKKIRDLAEAEENKLAEARAKAEAEIAEAKAKAEAEIAEAKALEAAKKAELEQIEVKRKHSFVLEQAHVLEGIFRSHSSDAEGKQASPSGHSDVPNHQPDLKELLSQHSKELHHVDVLAVEKSHHITPLISARTESTAINLNPPPQPPLPTPKPIEVPIVKPAPAKLKAVASMLQLSLSRIFNKGDSESSATDASAELAKIDDLDSAPSEVAMAPVQIKPQTPTPIPSVFTSPVAHVPVSVSADIALEPVAKTPIVPVNPSDIQQSTQALMVPLNPPISNNSENASPPPPPIKIAPVEVAITEAVVTAPSNPSDIHISQIRFHVKKVKYPAERLARRIKIWYCSSGFSLSTEQEIDQFVSELQQTGDSTLQSFSQEKFDNILDWAHLLEVLRKYEGKMLVEEALEHEDLSNSWVIEVTAQMPSMESNPVTFKITEGSSLDAIAHELSQSLGVTEANVRKELPLLLTANGNSPVQVGLEQLKDDLIFAEDLVLYQEEVIDHLWESYTVLKSVVEQKDDVINQLYAELSDTKEKNSTNTTARHNTVTDTSTGKSAALTFEDVNKEFANADKNGDGVISREEWRNWIDEKHKLVQSHNEVKSSLINEIRTLRKSLNPNSEQAFLDLQKSENMRIKLEEELVRTQIQCDQLRSELTQVQIKLQESETEKSMIESDWQERYTTMMDRFGKKTDGSSNTNHLQMSDNVSNSGRSYNDGMKINGSGASQSEDLSDYSHAMDPSLYADPGVGIIGRLSLVESKVKLFDNKFNDTSSSASFPHPSRSKSMYSAGPVRHPSPATDTLGNKPSTAEYPVDLSLRSSYPPGNGLYHINKSHENVPSINQLAERISSTASSMPQSSSRQSFGGSSNSVPTLSDLAAFNVPPSNDDKPSHESGLFLSSKNPTEVASYEEKKSSRSKPGSSSSNNNYSISPYSQPAASQSLALYEPSYPEFKPTSSNSPPPRRPQPRPNLNRPASQQGAINLPSQSSHFPEFANHLANTTNNSDRQLVLRTPHQGNGPGMLLSNSNSDHPLRTALRADTFSKLNGKGITMMTTRPYFKFNPKSKQSPKFENTLMHPRNEEDFSSNFGLNNNMNQPPLPPPRFMSNTSSSHKRTASWEASATPATVSGRRVLLSRNSGGWKWK